MNDLEALQTIVALKKQQGKVPKESVQQWDAINEVANKAYDRLYREAKHGFKKMGLPDQSFQLLSRCDPHDLFKPGDLLNCLLRILRPIAEEFPKSVDLLNDYLGRMHQLLELSYRIIAALAPVQSPEGGMAKGGAAPSAPSGNTSDGMEERHEASQRGAQAKVDGKGPYALPVRQVRTPGAGQPPQYPQAQPPLSLQDAIIRNTEAMAKQVDQAQSALVDARSRMDGMRQQLLSALPQFVMRQDWEALSGQLHKAEVGRRDLRATVITKIIEVIFDMETMYGAPPSDGGYEPADEHASKFEMAIRATVNRLESILRDEFNIERIPIQRNTIFDPRCMEADRHEETPPSSDMAGNVAHVIAPGYWIPLADGDTELYRRAKVRRFKGGRR